MANQEITAEPRLPETVDSDGTSQAGRVLAALDPGYVAVDERDIAAQLAFAAKLGKRLKYIGEDGKPQGTFGEFLGDDLSTEEVAAFLRDPEKFSPRSSPALFRPHRVLFFTFLKLLEKSRDEMNRITGRHLDFYFREYLRMTRKPSVPDRVNVIIDLLPGSSAAMLPRGSLLDAGVDELGKNRVYSTERELIVNRAQIAKLSSLQVNRERLTMRKLAERYRNDHTRASEAIFRLALGDPPPPYPDKETIGYDKLKELHEYLKRAETDYFLSIPDLRDLASRRALRPPLPAEWTEIHAELEKVGRKVLSDDGFRLPVDLRDFEKCVELAIAGPVDLRTLSRAKKLDDLFGRQDEKDVEDFIKGTLHFDRVDDFMRVLELKRNFDRDWREINTLIERAGKARRKDPAFVLTRNDPADFSGNLREAIGRDDLESYCRGIVDLETYFFLPEQAELFAHAMQEVRSVRVEAWDGVYSIVAAIYTQRQRSERLKRIAELGSRSGIRIVDLFRYVLGEPAAAQDDPSAMDRINLLLSVKDFDSLQPFVKKYETATLTPAERETLYKLLEVAERNRRGEGPPEIESWLNLSAAEDATTIVRPGAGKEAASPPRWALFGMAPPPSQAQPAEPAPLIGWALSSPLLLLGEGTRQITLDLQFKKAALPIASVFANASPLPLRFELSTSEGFIECAGSCLPVSPEPAVLPARGELLAGANGTSGDALDSVRFVLALPKTAPAIVAPSVESFRCGSPWPVLRLLLRSQWDPARQQYIARYNELAERVLMAARLKIEVTELRGLQLRNDDATLDGKKPFEPFTMHPVVGSRLLLGHRELVGKKLDSLTLHIKWLGAPDDLGEYYRGYARTKELVEGKKQPDFRFTAKLTLIDHVNDPILADNKALFSSSGKNLVEISVPSLPAKAKAVAPETIAANWLDEDLCDWQRYLELELLPPDFQHGDYPKLAAFLSRQAVSQAVATEKNATFELNVPYTPKCRSLSVDYVSSVELQFDAKTSAQSAHRTFHIHPFGVCDSEAERTGVGLPFLPQYWDDGELYIGLRDVAAPQTISLFFQMAEGSGNPDVEPPPIRWSYLSSDRWLPLDDRVLSDTTRGLRNSGIVELALPPAGPSTRLSGDLYYVRAALLRDTDAICDCCGISTQAVTAVFVDQGNAPAHFREPLPAGTITSLVASPIDIAGVRQPYTSSGGRSAESESAFATRVSERLRHKQRALTPWDYERLVLDRFPEIYKVKCIPAAPDAPGEVTLIVIPDIRNRLPFEPLEPKAPLKLLAEVQEYVLARTPRFVKVTVKNAHYTAVRVSLGVRFSGVGNDEFYKKKLCEELCRYLCPWAYEEGMDIVIGGRIYASSIVDFVDRRPYIDYVGGIVLYSSEDGKNFRPVQGPPLSAEEDDADADGYFIGASRPDEVLLAARSHQIDVISNDLWESDLKTGVDFMRIEFDFAVNPG